MVTDTNPGWKRLGQEFQQEKEGKRGGAGERKTINYIEDPSMQEGREEREGTWRGRKLMPGEPGGRDFSGAG